MKKVRILLRVSSDQQLESDGDLGIQRRIVVEYVQQHNDWVLDSKEYFEGSNSGYKNSVADRDVLQEALRDAERGEYDILAAYKDDRLGRRVLEIPTYILNLKKAGVDVYTVKDGILSPENMNDVNSIVMLTMRYAMAQKSSSDTGLRVKDTAQKLVQQGKFMGGKAPYGYVLEYSGKYSKHQRALKHPVIVPEQADVVRHIYDLSFYKEYGSCKIASVLNADEKYNAMAPNDVWKGGTVRSILMNPIYAGYTAYKRREHIDGKFISLDSKDWILAEKPNDEITIVDRELWQKVQQKIQERGEQYKKNAKNENVTVISRNDGILALIDVAHCGYCGCKLTNGTKYNYWTIKDTGERRTSKQGIYKCQNVWQGAPHPKMKQIVAKKIEPIVFEALAEYISILQENENAFEQIVENQNKEKRQQEKNLKKEKDVLAEIRKDIETMEDNIPKAMDGRSDVSLKDLMRLINRSKEKEEKQLEVIAELEQKIKNTTASIDDWESLRAKIPTWREVFLKADAADKRVLVDKLIERIDITNEQVNIRFKINLSGFLSQPRMTGDGRVSRKRLRLYHHLLHRLRPKVDIR